MPEIPIDPAMLSRDPAVGAAYLADPLVYTGPLLRRSVEAILVDAVATITAGPKLDPYPTLWLHGELDPLAPYAEARASLEPIRGARFSEKVYPGAVHEIFNETNRDEVLDDLVAFLRSVL
jgi:alpha-beta hydrolase superfamily lysophospholipase